MSSLDLLTYVISIYLRILISIMISISVGVHFVNTNTTGAICVAGTGKLSGAPDFIPVFVGFVLFNV